MPTTPLDWDTLFAQAGRTLLVANFRPNHETARNLYAEDRPHIHAAADRHRFRVLHTGKTVCFIRHLPH